METKLVMCDTNIFIHWFRNDAQTIEKLMAIGVENIVISAITKMELLLGTENKQELAAMKRKISSYPVIPITDAVSVRAIEYIESYRLSHNLQIPDALIGATATNFDLSLFTYNLKDFRFLPNIKLYD
jgi:hypothetical protein